MFHMRDARGNADSEDTSGAAAWNVGSALLEARGPDELERDWYSWMRKYSRRDFTYPRDRLPGISGLAKRVAKDVPHPYRAGHWYSPTVFWRSLFWTIYHPPSDFNDFVESLTLPARYVAPSWSWASRMHMAVWTRFPLSEESPSRLYKCNIKNCDVELAGVDDTGAVKSGKITVIGRLKPVPAPPSSGEYIAKNSRKKHQWTWLVPLKDEQTALYTLDFLPDLENTNNAASPENKLQMLLLGINESRYRSDPEENTGYNLWGLLLYPHGDEFLRVGIFALGKFHNENEEFFNDVEDKIITII